MTDATRTQPRGTAQRRNGGEFRTSLIARRSERARRRAYRAI
ncbi:hypothetical protein [Robiginitomaculum antarcticum]|nr:hypothetical protein [Robiginitomaculum antarcticum]